MATACRLLLVLSVVALSGRAQLLPSEDGAPSDGLGAVQALNRAVTLLDQTLLHQLDGEMWGSVEEEVALGVEQVALARRGGLPADACLATLRTLRAVGERQALLWREVMAETEAQGVSQDPEAQQAWLDQEYAAIDSGLATLADELGYFEGTLAQTSWLRAELLFNMGRDAEGAEVLALGLALWPSDADLHDQARAWAHVLPAPEHLINQLLDRADTLDVADADYAGIGLETVAVLQTALGQSAYDQREFTLAGVAFDRAARSLQRARTMPRQWNSDEIDYRRADNLVNAAYSFLGLALDLWYADRNDPRGLAAAETCESLLSDALEAVPGHPAASQAVLVVGDHLLTKSGDMATSTPADQGHARDFFGRMAERFDVADWWNNHAFWSRETGTAAEWAGDAQTAEKLFEQSYHAYERTIALAPDNARYVNDTGLMLFYHLGRDAERAAELFHRAWQLGRDVCDNPFVDEAVFEDNFLAYTDAMLNLSLLHLQEGDLGTADDVCAQLLELAPERADARAARRSIDEALADD